MARKLLKHFLAGCFCICLAWLAARIVIYFLIPPSLPEFYFLSDDKNGHAAMSRDRAVVASASMDAVLRRNLFHAVVEKPPAADAEGREHAVTEAEKALMLEEIGKLPISKQGWTLAGTIVNTLVPAQSRAIVMVNGKQGAYARGEDLKGWKIALIDRRTVIMEKNGRRERLLVGGRDINQPQPAKPAAVRKSINAGDIEKAINNLPDLAKQVGFAATQQNGVYGLGVTFLQPDSFIASLGLRQNDILTSANGKNIAGIGDLAALGRLSGQDSLRLELIRNGKNIVLEYDINR